MDVPPAPGGAPPDATFGLATADGVGLRAGVWRGARRGLVLFFTGRTEYLEKAGVPAAALVARGFSVASLDWRGQGLSDRLIDPPEKGHVGDFRDYLLDIDALLGAPEVRALGPPALTIAHSMGGAIALEARAAGRLPAAPMVLTAPMLGIAMNPALEWMTRALIAMARLGGRPNAWPPFGNPARPYSSTAPFEGNMLTGDRAVYDWLRAVSEADPRLGLGMPSLAWIARAWEAMARIARMGPLALPALCLVGDAERVVDRRAVSEGCTRLGATCVEIPEGRHELLIEAEGPRSAAWAEIDAFLAREGI